MLLCDKAYTQGTKRPQKILCRITGGPCVHVRYCANALKYYQTDNALKCLAKEAEKNGQNNETGQNS